MKTHARCLALFAWIACVWAPDAFAQDYRIEKLEASAPTDELSEEVVARLNNTGLKVMRGESRTVCEFWLAKEWTASDVQITPQRLYPFDAGQLVGVIRYPRRASDFRDQTVDSGVYTLRYGLQPVDGAHVGTSITRDFLVLVSAEQDQSASPMETDEMNQASAESIGSSHPGILSLKKAPDSAGEAPGITHDEMHDWWIAHFEGTVRQEGQTRKLPVALVVVGVAAE